MYLYSLVDNVDFSNFLPISLKKLLQILLKLSSLFSYIILKARLHERPSHSESVAR